MLEHPDLGDNHNAPVFHSCYKRMGELIPQLLAEGSQPRIMPEYSGTLLHGHGGYRRFIPSGGCPGACQLRTVGGAQKWSPMREPAPVEDRAQRGGEVDPAAVGDRP